MRGTPVRQGLFYFDDDGDARLVGGRCASCGKHHFPLLEGCPYCGSTTVTQVALSQRGLLWAWTSVAAAPPGYGGDLPFGFGVVELPERIRIITRLSEADPSRLVFHQEMVLEIVPVRSSDEDGPLLTYSFAPAGSRAAASTGGASR